MYLKICSTCKRSLSILTSFSKDKTRKDNLSNVCKDCRKVYNKNYYNWCKDELENKRRQWNEIIKKVTNI